jgi:hypothetical protein
VISIYFMAALLLSAAAFLHTRSIDPELRPQSPMTDAIWRIISRVTHLAWMGLIVWGGFELHWTQPVAAFIGSLAVNAVIARLRPLPVWPGLSMLMAAAGFAAAARVVFG